MHGLSVEYYERGNKPLSKVVTRRIADESCSKVVVVVPNPRNLLSSVRKEWRHLIYRTQVEQAQTLNHDKINALAQKLAYMQHATFSAEPPGEIPAATITLASADDLLRTAPTCRAMHITYDLSTATLHLITAWMPPGGCVILYEP